MRWLASVPLWAIGIAALASAGLLLWRTLSLMATRQQKMAVLKAIAVAVVFIGLIAGIKRNSAGHAMVLFADGMVAWTIGTLPVGRQMKAVNARTAETGFRQSLGPRNAKIGAYTMVGVLVVLLAVEYLIP